MAIAEVSVFGPGLFESADELGAQRHEQSIHFFRGIENVRREPDGVEPPLGDHLDDDVVPVAERHRQPLAIDRR